MCRETPFKNSFSSASLPTRRSRAAMRASYSASTSAAAVSLSSPPASNLATQILIRLRPIPWRLARACSDSPPRNSWTTWRLNSIECVRCLAMGFLPERPVQLADSHLPHLSTPRGALHNIGIYPPSRAGSMDSLAQIEGLLSARPGGGPIQALNRSRPHDQGVVFSSGAGSAKSAGLEDGDDRCPACDPRSFGLRHDQEYRNPAFHYRGTRSHRRREVLFRSRRLPAPALERALFFHGMWWQLLRAGKDPPSRQSEQSR